MSLCPVVLVSFLQSAPAARAAPQAADLALSERQVIVRVPRASARGLLESVLAREGWGVVDELPALDLLLVELPHAVGETDALVRLAAVPGVAFAEPNGRGRGGELVPNDTYFGVQWPLYNNGQSNGRTGADIEALPAWSLARGSASVIVAVLDTGLTPNHPEFAGRVLPGHDFVFDDADPFDDHNHGTAVSGILAANADNAFGLAGVDRACTLLPVKILDRVNGGSTFDLAQGLTFAADAGADVINMSLIDYPSTSTVTNALSYARDAGCVLIACAGNGGVGDADVSFPGRSPLVISVGASTRLDLRASFSGTGLALDLVAPGANVPATPRVTTDSWVSFGGCSAATPIVSGMAAVLLSVDPTLTHDEIQQLLQAGAEDQVGDPTFDVPGRDNYHGFGRANLLRSLCELDTGGPTIVAPDVLRVDSSGPSGATADDAAVSAALASIHATDDLDPTPKVKVTAPSVLPFGQPVDLPVLALDACGHTTSRTLAILAVDLRAPKLSVAADPKQLDPTSGGLVLVGPDVRTSDAVDPRPRVDLRVHADEPPSRTAADAALDGKRRLLLRATRDGAGDGRVYLLIVRSRDAAGNEALAVATVVVPKDGSPGALALVLDQAARAEAETLASGTPPPGFFELLPGMSAR